MTRPLPANGFPTQAFRPTRQAQLTAGKSGLKVLPWTSLVVLWIRVRLANVGDTRFGPWSGDATCRRATKLHAAATELAHLESVLGNKRSPCTTAESSRSLQPEKAPRAAVKTQHSLHK